MDVARLNFSHGNHDEHGLRARDGAERERSARQARRDSSRISCGPKIRTGKTGPAALDAGQTIDLISGRQPASDRTIAIDYEGLADDVRSTIASCSPTARSSSG